MGTRTVLRWSIAIALSKPNVVALFAGVTLLAVSSPGLFAQGSDYSLQFFSTPAVIGESESLYVRLDNPSGDVVQGWSFGVCYDETAVTFTGLSYFAAFSPPEFVEFIEEPGGWISNVVLSSAPGVGLPPSALPNYLVVAHYTALGPPQTTEFCFCDGLGIPPSSIVLSTTAGPVVPTTACLSVLIAAAPEWTLALEDRELYYPLPGGVREFDVVASLSVSDAAFGNQAAGFSCGATHDPDLLEIQLVRPVGVLSYFVGAVPASAQFFGVSYYDDSWTLGVVFGGFSFLEFGTVPDPVFAATYTTVAGALSGADVTTSAAFASGLGSPPVPVTIVLGGATHSLTTVDSTITLHPYDGDLFRRGDCNDDGTHNIADGVTMLTELFSAGVAGPCRAACDTNADALYDVADPVYLFNYLLLGGPPPTAPFDECDGDAQAWTCDSYTSCP
ncbi:MAG: hypothetical protein KDC38_02505 [Planctomycetes bacterium]|nr:hypothetical protein [Planctomycetota bacterium]